MYRISSEELNLWQLISKISSIEDNQIEFLFSQNSPLLENLLAFKIIKKRAGDFKKEVVFRFEDKNFLYLAPILNSSELEGGKNKPEDAPSSFLGDETLEESPPTTSLFKFRLGLPKFNFNLKFGYFWTLSIAGFVLLILGVGFSYYYFIPKTEVSLEVDSEPLARAFEVTAAASASSAPASSPLISAIEISSRAKKSEATSSSGRKDLGDKALGSVTIYNKTATLTNLPAGTVLSNARVNGDDLRFLLKSAVAVPARTANSLTVSGYDPGTADVDVVAENFGEDYNLASGSTFIVAAKSTNDFIANNVASFSGGTKRQATVVTLADQRNLLENLVKTVKDELKTSLLAKLIDGQNLDENSITNEILTKTFDQNVGDEADRLLLTLEMKATVLAFSQSDLKNAVYAKLLSYVPDGYQLFGNQPEVEILETKTVGKVLKISARGKGFIVPKIDADVVKRKILGKSLVSVEDYLKSLPNLSSHKIDNPLKFGPFSFLPFRAQSLKVEVVKR